MGWQEQQSRRERRDKPHAQPTVGGILERRRNEPPPSRPEYARFRKWLLDQIIERALKPVEVAQLLEKYADRFPEIELEECRRYREWGDTWRQVPA